VENLKLIEIKLQANIECRIEIIERIDLCVWCDSDFKENPDKLQIHFHNRCVCFKKVGATKRTSKLDVFIYVMLQGVYKPDNNNNKN
jgi:hypothetical protein